MTAPATLLTLNGGGRIKLIDTIIIPAWKITETYNTDLVGTHVE